jgi:hypothetical protein
MDQMLVVECKGIRERADGRQVYVELKSIHERLDLSPDKLVAAPRKRTRVAIPDAVAMPETDEIKSLYRNQDAIAQVPEHSGRVWGTRHSSKRNATQIGGLTRRTSTH